MTIRESLNGLYTRADLDRLGWPIAWSSTISPEERTAEEAALSDLLDEGRARFYENSDLYAVEIRGGEILWTLTCEQYEKEIRERQSP